jgi:hypothetical protein
MKTTKKTVNLTSISLTPKAVRKAYKLASAAAWICAKTEAEAIWREKLALLENKLIEAERIREVQTAEILDLRRKLEFIEAKAEAASSTAHQGAVMATHQIANLKDAVRRAVDSAASISTQLETLINHLQPAPGSPAAQSEEMQTGRQTPDPRNERERPLETLNTVAVDPKSPNPRDAAGQTNTWLQEESQLVAAATLLIKALCRSRRFRDI